MAQVIQSTYTTMSLPVLRSGNWRAVLLHPVLRSFALSQHKLAGQAAVGHRGRQRRGCPFSPGFSRAEADPNAPAFPGAVSQSESAPAGPPSALPQHKKRCVMGGEVNEVVEMATGNNCAPQPRARRVQCPKPSTWSFPLTAHGPRVPPARGDVGQGLLLSRGTFLFPHAA